MSREEIPAPAIRLFYSYSHNDEALLKKLRNHLSLLRQQSLINEWHDRNIDAGADWKYQIDVHLNNAHIILLLISSDFIASEYCYSIEMQQALDKHEAGSARVIPVLIRPADWKTAPFAKLQVLPRNAQPITTWENQDLAYEEIAIEIRAVVTQNRSKNFDQIDLGMKNDGSKASTNKNEHRHIEISEIGRSGGKEGSIPASIVDKLNTLHRYQKIASELKRVHNMLHEIENSLVGLTTIFQVPLLLNENEERTNLKGWLFARRNVVRKEIDHMSIKLLTIRPLWQEVRSKIDDLKYFASKEMIALDEPAFIFDSTGVRGPLWIIELLGLQNDFEANMRKQNANEMNDLSFDLLETCRAHLRSIDKELLKTVKEADTLSDNILRSVQ